VVGKSELCIALGTTQPLLQTDYFNWSFPLCAAPVSKDKSQTQNPFLMFIKQFR